MNFGIKKSKLNKCVRLYSTFGKLNSGFLIKLMDVFPSEVIVSLYSIDKENVIFQYFKDNSIQHLVTPTSNPYFVNVTLVLPKQYATEFFTSVFDGGDFPDTVEVYNSTVPQSIEECMNSNCINRVSQGYSDASCVVSFDKDDMYVYTKNKSCYYQKIIDFIKSERLNFR